MIENNENAINLVIENLTSILPLLSKNVMRAFRSQINLSPGAIYTLGALAHHGKLSMSGIGCHLLIPKPHVTSVVDKLIAEDLVERLYDPNDRRIIYIQITEKGTETLKEIKSLIVNGLGQKLQILTDEQLQTLLTSSQQVRDILMGILREQQPCSASSPCKPE